VSDIFPSLSETMFLTCRLACSYHNPSYGSKTCPYNANGGTATDSASVTGGGAYDGYCNARMTGNTACPSKDIFGQALESSTPGQLGCRQVVFTFSPTAETNLWNSIVQLH
jgi:hypothetical protein